MVSTASILVAGIALAACTAEAPASTALPTAGPAVTARPTSVPTASAAPTSSAAPSMAPTPTAGASYDLAAVYTACVDASVAEMKLPGEPLGAESSRTEPASTNVYLKERFADDADALAYYYDFDADSEEIADIVPVLCSVSGPFDSPTVTFERALT
jgi:hypothetical protein